MSRFGSSRRSLIKIFKISFVNIWVNFSLTGLEELFHGINLKEMFIFREFVGETSFLLSEYWSLSCSLGSIEFSSKDSNSIKSVLVFLKLLDEKLVGFTSGNVKLDELSSNCGESVIDPFKMVFGVLDFSFNPFSVFSSLLSNLSVSVGNSSEVGNGFSTINLLLIPTGLVFFLFLINGIL